MDLDDFKGRFTLYDAVVAVFLGLELSGVADVPGWYYLAVYGVQFVAVVVAFFVLSLFDA